MRSAAVPAQRHFEVHVQQNGRWTVDCVLDEIEEAMKEAKVLLGKPQIAGVRVVREIYDPRTALAYEQVLHEELKAGKGGPLHRR